MGSNYYNSILKTTIQVMISNLYSAVVIFEQINFIEKKKAGVSFVLEINTF